MPKCDFNKVALQLYWNCTSAWVFSCKYAAYFQNTFSQEHLWRTASGDRRDNKFYFLHVEVIHEQVKLTTIIYRKATFSGVYSYFEIFLPAAYKFSMISTLVYRYFRICLDWAKGFTELNYIVKYISKKWLLWKLYWQVF